MRIKTRSEGADAEHRGPGHARQLAPRLSALVTGSQETTLTPCRGLRPVPTRSRGRSPGPGSLNRGLRPAERGFDGREEGRPGPRLSEQHPGQQHPERGRRPTR